MNKTVIKNNTIHFPAEVKISGQTNGETNHVSPNCSNLRPKVAKNGASDKKMAGTVLLPTAIICLLRAEEHLETVTNAVSSSLFKAIDETMAEIGAGLQTLDQPGMTEDKAVSTLQELSDKMVLADDMIKLAKVTNTIKEHVIATTKDILDGLEDDATSHSNAPEEGVTDGTDSKRS